MNAFAVDTNVAIYAFSADHRTDKARVLMQAGPSISVQLLNEFAFVSLRKKHVPWSEIEESLDVITGLAASLRPVGEDVHRRAVRLAQRYKLRFYDALLVAAAVLDECDRFYSEDMQHGLVIDGTLTIVNPFLPAEST